MIVDCIIPLFNKKNYVSKAVKSAITQKLKNLTKLLLLMTVQLMAVI